MKADDKTILSQL